MWFNRCDDVFADQQSGDAVNGAIWTDGELTDLEGNNYHKRYVYKGAEAIPYNPDHSIDLTYDIIIFTLQSLLKRK